MSPIRYGRVALALALVPLAGGTTATAAQTVTRIPDEPPCASCSVRLEPVVLIGSLDDPAGFSPSPVQIAVDSRGRYAVSASTFVGEVFIYGADGKFVRSIGRRGEGPGEFTGMQFLAFDAEDSLHAVNMSGPQHSVFAPDLTFVRTVQLGTRVMVMKVEASGRIFATAPTPGPGTAEFVESLKVFSPDGEAVASFDPPYPGVSGWAGVSRAITIDASGRLWSVGTYRYKLTEWNDEGTPLRRFEAEREWIPDVVPPMGLRLPEGQLPPAQIGGLEFDEAGLLWVFVIAPDEDWQPPQPGGQGARGETSPPSLDDVFDTIVEVLDPATGTLVSRSREDALVLPFARGRGYSMVEDAAGDVKIQVWRMRVDGR